MAKATLPALGLGTFRLKGEPLSEFIDRIQIELGDIGQHISQTWFRSAPE